MKSILEKMYYGQKFIMDEVPYSARMKENERKITELEEEFAKHLTEEQKKLFWKYVDDVWGVVAENNMLGYIEGVKIGILIGIEAAEVFDENE